MTARLLDEIFIQGFLGEKKKSRQLNNAAGMVLCSCVALA